MKFEVDLMKYAQMMHWSPNVGDFIYKDGMFFRWCAVVTGIKEDKIVVRKSGNIHLLVSGDYEETILNIRKIKSASYGSYFIISDGTYYV